jgi:uncharacterized membrane protein
MFSRRCERAIFARCEVLAARPVPEEIADMHVQAQAIDTERLALSRGKRVGVGFVFLFFLVGGIAHFAITELEMRIVPPYIPWPRAAVLVSGAFELLGAFGLLFTATRRAAGIGLFVLTICVTPANVYMLQEAAQFDVPYWLLVARLPLQVALLALIAWSTFR